jgi:hypothetical protein
MDVLLLLLFLSFMFVCFSGAWLIVEDKQRDFLIRREIENRRYKQ